MLSCLSRNASSMRTGARCMSTIPVNQIASVLKLNAGGEAKALQLDAHFKQVGNMMKAHPGYLRANRYVCKTEWAYEISFLFKDIDSFKAWKTSKVRDEVHASYLAAIKAIGFKESEIYAGARVYDELK